MKKGLLLWLILFFNTVTVYANLITMDWKVANDGLILRETDSNLEWLNLKQSDGMSYNQVLAMTDNPGDLFEGWHIARKSEMFSLFNAVGGDGNYSRDGLNHGAGNSFDLLMQYWGISFRENKSEYVIYDFVNWFQDDPQVRFAWLYNHPNYDADGVFIPAPFGDFLDMDTENCWDLDFGLAGISVALVRTATPVPEPTALFLIGTGLAGLVGTCRKMKA